MKHIQHILISVLVLGALMAPLTVHAQIHEAAGSAQLVHRQPTAHIQTEDERVKKLEGYLASHNSPMAREAKQFIEIADKYGLDWRLVAAIAGTESLFGRYIPPGSYNAWGWGIPTGTSRGLAFSDWEDGIETVSEGLKTRYVDRGAENLDQIGRIYAADPRWSGKVQHFMNNIQAFVPDKPSLMEMTI